MPCRFAIWNYASTRREGFHAAREINLRHRNYASVQVLAAIGGRSSRMHSSFARQTALLIAKVCIVEAHFASAKSITSYRQL